MGKEHDRQSVTVSPTMTARAPGHSKRATAVARHDLAERIRTKDRCRGTGPACACAGRSVSNTLSCTKTGGGYRGKTRVGNGLAPCGGYFAAPPTSTSPGNATPEGVSNLRYACSIFVHAVARVLSR